MQVYEVHDDHMGLSDINMGMRKGYLMSTIVREAGYPVLTMKLHLRRCCIFGESSFYESCNGKHSQSELICAQPTAKVH